MCKDCEARRTLAREAWQKHNFAEALKHVAKGAAEAVGVKEHTGEDELIEKRSTESRRDRTNAQ